MPERMGQWTLLGHDSDPVVADTAQIDERVAHYRKLADEMQANAERLDRIADGTALKGRYADELRSSSGEVARDLHKVVGRYQAVATALERYEPEVQRALSESQGALDDAGSANGLSQAAAGMTTEQPAEGQQLTADQTAHNDEKTARTNQAADALSAAKARLSSALGALDAAGQAAARTISGGFDDGLKDSGWDRFVYGFMKFLKILVKILTYLAMALAVIALVIPGLGAAIFAAGLAIAAVDVAANAALVAAGEGTWADFGIALAGLLTFGVGKLFGPAIQAGLKSVGTSVKSSVSGALDTARGIGRGAGRGADDAIPLLDRGPVRPPRVPEGSTRVDDPDLGEANNAFRTGESWRDANGTTWSRLDDFTGYRGVDDVGRDAHAIETRFQDGMRNGNDVDDWKGLYVTDNVEDAKAYAKEGLWEFKGGHVLEYRHGDGVTVASPSREVTSPEEARELFGVGPGGERMLDQLGRDGVVVRNPIGDGTEFEYIVPWNLAKDSPLGRVGSFGPHRDPDKAPWISAVSDVAGPSTGGLRERIPFDAALV